MGQPSMIFRLTTSDFWLLAPFIDQIKNEPRTTECGRRFMRHSGMFSHLRSPVLGLYAEDFASTQAIQ